MSNIKFRLVGGLHTTYYECTICVIHKGKEGFLVLLKAVAAFSNLSGLIVIECPISLSVLLSKTPKSGGGGYLKPLSPPQMTALICMNVF